LSWSFDHVTLPDSTAYPISARVLEVDKARARVDRNGLIRWGGSYAYSDGVGGASLRDVVAETPLGYVDGGGRAPDKPQRGE
jgi:hypothetical protein